MTKYNIKSKIQEVSKDIESAVIVRYLQNKYYSTIIIGSILIGFLLGLLANWGINMNDEQKIRESIALEIEAVDLGGTAQLNGLGMRIIAAEIARGK